MADGKSESVFIKRKRLFQQFARGKTFLIVDPQAYSRSALSQALINLGAETDQIKTVKSFAMAEELIEKDAPEVLITEFDLDGGMCGLDLLASQRKKNPKSKELLFILVTGNTSQSAVAQAAEELVDGYLIKPYSAEGLRTALMKYSLEKAFPSAYTKKIEEGKELLAENRIEEAQAVFMEASKLDPKPALAWFYHGFAEELKKAFAQAEKDYHKGLEKNRIHYKCMVGLYELYMSLKRYKEAYDIVRRLARYFPANADRLSTVLRLAILTNSYSDIEGYYQLFCKLEQRHPNLVRHVSAALLVCGKHYLIRRNNSRATDLFKKACVASGNNPKFLREIILNLLDADLDREAQKFVEIFEPEAQAGSEFRALQYAVEERQLGAGFSITRARDLIDKGVEDPLVYQILIKRSKESGHLDGAETAAESAKKLWPDLAADFDRILTTTKSKVKEESSS
jgi:two-component system chemotaxis response regulator CheY